jgi:precorrin-3B synthase
VAADAGESFRAAIADFLLSDASPASAQEPGEPIGAHPLRDGTSACGVGLAFGHADATALDELIQMAAAQGASGMRATPGRVILILGLTQHAVAPLMTAAEGLGFVVRTDDRRRYVFACAGAPICASAHIPARALAPRITEVAASRLGPSFDIHISGCSKGCAHSKRTALAVVGTSAGCALIAGGTARDVAFATTSVDELSAAVTRHISGQADETGHV